MAKFDEIKQAFCDLAAIVGPRRIEPLLNDIIARITESDARIGKLAEDARINAGGITDQELTEVLGLTLVKAGYFALHESITADYEKKVR